MKSHRTFVVGGMLCCFLVLLAGCSSSELVDVWSDTSFQSPLNKMLVISVGRNQVHRRIWEDAFSAELVKHNIATTPSYRLFPDAVPDTSQIMEIMRSRGYDGFLVTRWLPPEMKTQYMEGYVTDEHSTKYDRRGNTFVTYYHEMEHAGYVDSQKVNIRSIDVWATKNDGQMIWSALCKTPEPYSAEEARPEIVRLVMSELKRLGFIPSKH